MNTRIGTEAFKTLQDGIVYLFQFGFITEKKHFKLLEELNDKYTL